MQVYLNTIARSPLSIILILVGLLFLLLGLGTKIGKVKLTMEQKKWTAPLGLFVLSIGLVLYSVTPDPNRSAADRWNCADYAATALRAIEINQNNHKKCGISDEETSGYSEHKVWCVSASYADMQKRLTHFKKAIKRCS